MKIVVLHQSRTGNTKKAAELIGGAVQSSGAEVTVRPISNIDYKELADADLIFVGTWVDVRAIFMWCACCMCVHVLCMCADASGVWLAFACGGAGRACGWIVRVSHGDDGRS